MISPIEGLAPITGSVLEPGLAAENPSMFGLAFQSAIVKETDAEKVEAEYLLATGQLDNPASLMIASSKSELAVSLLVQLRNRALDAYSELTRISL